MAPPHDTVDRDARFRRLAMGAVLLAGAALRLWEYLANASLWVDELALSESILYRPLRELLVLPLKVGQAAPAGFLAAVKLSTMLFGPSALAMRLPALLFTLAGLGLFAAVARRLLSGWTAVFATVPRGLTTPPLSVAAWKAVFGNRKVQLLLVVTCVFLAGQFAEYPFVAAHLKTAVGADPSTIAILFAVYGFAGVIGSTIAAAAIDRLGGPRTTRVSLVFVMLGLLVWSLSGTSVLLAGLSIMKLPSAESVVSGKV